MKKMQCEVCGSTSIKKVGDTVFECQSCGTQYSKEEVQKLLVEITGTVKIDHSEDIENTLKRAEQFEKEGDVRKAEQYYEKVLDMEPENSKATEKIKGIKKEKAKPQNMYILERTISPESAFDSFIKGLMSLKNIAPDVYKEISIISKSECYYPFAVMYGTYSGSYSGTACFKKEVPVTVEKIKEKYIDGQFRKVKVQEIEYRTEIDKQPASGTYSAKCREIYSLSSCLTDYCSGICLGKLEKDFDFISILEEYFDDVYNNYIDNIKKLDIDNLNVDIPLADETIDEKLLQRGTRLYKKVIDGTCSSVARRCVGGNYSENVTYNWGTDYQETFYLYLPIQVVEFAYKGDIYLSVTALAEGCKKNNVVYPYYNTVDNVESEGNREVYKASHKGTYGFIAWLFAALFGGIGWFQGLTNSPITGACNTIAIGCAILGALQTTLGVIKLIQSNKIKNEYLQKMEQLTQGKENELKKEFKLFFNSYKGINSIEDCCELVRKNSTFSCKDEEISGRANNDYFDDDNECDEDDEDYEDEE